MKAEKIIYYNELTGLVEPFTQKNINENSDIMLGGELSCSPEEVLNMLMSQYECFAKTANPEVSLYFALKQFRDCLVIDLGVQLKEWAEVDRGITLHGATLTFKKGDIIIKGVKGEALAQISNIKIDFDYIKTMYLTAVYQTVGNIALALSLIHI